MFETLSSLLFMRKKNLSMFVGALLMTCLIITPAMASDWGVASANVTRIQASGVPANFDFVIDQPAGPCAAGTWISFNFDNTLSAANVQAVYDTLVTSIASKLPVSLFGLNPDITGFCRLQYIHLLQGATISAPQAAMTGNCISNSNPGQSFILNGLGQTFLSNCTFQPPTNSADLRLYGAMVPRAGTITGLVAKQVVLPNGIGGGTVQVWINPNSTSPPFFTGIQCSVNNNSCTDSVHRQTVNAGDKVVIIVVVSGADSVGPVNATLTIS